MESGRKPKRTKERYRRSENQTSRASRAVALPSESAIPMGGVAGFFFIQSANDERDSDDD